METQILKEYDYINVLVDINSVSYLLEYCYSIYEQLVELENEDEEKNKTLKAEYKDYMYRTNYRQRYEVTILPRDNYKRIHCDNFDKFRETKKQGYVKNVDELELVLNLSFRRGKEYEYKEHDNEFIIKFTPKGTTFTRKSNYEDEGMDSIENNIIKILNEFNTYDTIFCTKE